MIDVTITIYVDKGLYTLAFMYILLKYFKFYKLRMVLYIEKCKHYLSQI